MSKKKKRDPHNPVRTPQVVQMEANSNFVKGAWCKTKLTARKFVEYAAAWAKENLGYGSIAATTIAKVTSAIAKIKDLPQKVPQWIIQYCHADCPKPAQA